MGVMGVVLLVGLAAGLVMMVLSWRRGPIDPQESERWLLRHSPGRLRPWVWAVERRAFGGVAVAIALVLVFGAALALGWLFESIDTSQGFARWDQSAAEWGAVNATERSTDLFSLVTDLGSTGVLVVVMTAVAVIDYIRHRNPVVFLYLLVIGLGISLLNNGLKLAVDRDRPVISQLVGHSGSSFPSGHSASAAACWAAIAFVLTRTFRRRVRVIAAGIAVAVAVAVAGTRVALGVHWLTDVMAGLVVGWTWFFLVTLVLGGRLLRPPVVVDPEVGRGVVAPGDRSGAGVDRSEAVR